MQHNEEYTVIHGGTSVKCTSVEQVVEVVKRLEREVERPVAREEPRVVVHDVDLKDAVTELFAEERVPLRPIEIVKALRKRGVPKAQATYNKVYAALRYGPFAYDDGAWKLRSA